MNCISLKRGFSHLALKSKTLDLEYIIVMMVTEFIEWIDKGIRENLIFSDKSDKSMDLVKSTQSEDLSKDLQGNLRISPQKCEDFMMRWIE